MFSALTSPSPSPDRSARAWPWLALALVLALPLLVGLGSNPLFDVDEGAFSSATREMLASGDWGHTTLQGAPRFDKPIAVYWLQAASVALFGLNEWALRLPSALCTWLAALAVAGFVAPRHGSRLGALAGVMLVTALGPWAMARAATADALLNLCLMLTALDLWRHLEPSTQLLPNGQPPSRWPLRRCALWVGLGVLTKGPVAVLVPAAALGLWVLSRRDFGTLRRTLADPVAWALLLAVAAPWYAYALNRHGMAFVEGFILKHNVNRFTGPMEGHGGSLFYYLLVVPLLWLPWSPLWAGCVRRWRAVWRSPYQRYLLLWAGFVIVFFSLSGTKLPHYSLYAGPGLLLLAVAVLAEHDGEPGPAMRRTLWAAWLLALALFSLAPWLLQSGAIPVKDGLYGPLLRGAPLPVGPAVAGAAGLVCLLGLTTGAAGRARFLSRFTLAAWVLTLLLGGLVTPWLGEALQGPIERSALAARQAVAAAGEPSPPVHQWNVHWPSAGVYVGQAVPTGEPPPGGLAITRLDRLARTGVPVYILREENGVALVRRLVDTPARVAPTPPR